MGIIESRDGSFGHKETSKWGRNRDFCNVGASRKGDGKRQNEGFSERFGGFLGGKRGGFLIVFLVMSSIRHVRIKLISAETQLVTKTKV